jgi:hypothetical protein
MGLGLATSCAFPLVKPTWLDAVLYKLKVYKYWHPPEMFVTIAWTISAMIAYS